MEGLRAVLLAGVLAVAPLAARACSTALLLAIDVSNSIDPGEYRIQATGLADALADPQILDELVRGQVALSVMQWSGPGTQEVSIPWTRIRTAADVLALADRARAMPRAAIMSNTAVGDTLQFALTRFAAVPGCARHVIDISGDGSDNAGTDPRGIRTRAERQGVSINALAIEGTMGLAITGFYRRNVITRDGFVMTARGHRSYAETLKRKILREVSRVMF